MSTSKEKEIYKQIKISDTYAGGTTTNKNISLLSAKGYSNALF